VIFAKPEKPIPKSVRGAAKRKPTAQLYAEEVAALDGYAVVHNRSVL